MSQEQLVTGIVLQKQDSGENDRSLCLFTRELGKINILARGSRKASSKLSGIIEPFTMAQFQIVSGKYRYFIRQMQLVDSHHLIRTDYSKIMAAMALCEAYAAITPYEQVHPELFDQLKGSLKLIEQHDVPKIVFVWSLLKLLSYEGLLPSFIACTSHGSELSENPAWFSPAAGGYVSVGVANNYDDRFVVEAESLIALHKLASLSEPPERLKSIDSCLLVISRLLNYHVQRSLPAFKAFQKLDEN
jgi:DNA repair protein RecO (recombination protein O)